MWSEGSEDRITCTRSFPDAVSVELLCLVFVVWYCCLGLYVSLHPLIVSLWVCLDIAFYSWLKCWSLSNTEFRCPIIVVKSVLNYAHSLFSTLSLCSTLCSSHSENNRKDSLSSTSVVVSYSCFVHPCIPVFHCRSFVLQVVLFFTITCSDKSFAFEKFKKRKMLNMCSPPGHPRCRSVCLH